VICTLTCGFPVLAVCGIWLALRLRTVYARYRHHRQRLLYKAGRCLRCGYDLRESPNRCPECGADTLEQAKEFWSDEADLK
jgi:predicted Zn-ribbon and HTH transcriptional regulator